jgi:hypothetical protein
MISLVGAAAYVMRRCLTVLTVLYSYCRLCHEKVPHCTHCTILILPPMSCAVLEKLMPPMEREKSYQCSVSLLIDGSVSHLCSVNRLQGNTVKTAIVKPVKI